MTDLETKPAEALRAMDALYRSICGLNGWNADDLKEADMTREALAAYEREKAGQDIHCQSIEVGGYRIPVRTERS